MIDSATAFHRFGLGTRPGDLDRFPDIRAAVHEETANANAAILADPALLDSGTALEQLIEERHQQREQQQADVPRREMQPPIQQRAYVGELAARLTQYRQVGIGFVERLVAFWANHFAVEAKAGILERTLVGAFEREAIRPFVLGRFRDMLGAVTKHPAMLSYLDNAQSIGPNSPLGVRAATGLNENHARELLELHTIGVGAGYTQADVTAMARILTSWSFAGREGQAAPLGSFLFRETAHEPGAHEVLGRVYAAERTGVRRVCARHTGRPSRHRPPHRAQARKALRRRRAAYDAGRNAVWHLHVDGRDLKAVALALVDSDEALEDPTKIKTPQLFAWSALRALQLDVTPQQVVQALRSLGQPMWDPPSPEGFSDEAATWLAPDAMTSRLDIAELLAQAATIDESPIQFLDMILGGSVSTDTRRAVSGAESVTQALALLLMSPEFQRI